MIEELEEFESLREQGRQLEKLMPKRVAILDYHKCHPAQCNHGICLATLACEHGSLMQEDFYEAPERNPAKWCHGCAKCIQACPFQAIYMLRANCLKMA